MNTKVKTFNKAPNTDHGRVRLATVQNIVLMVVLVALLAMLALVFHTALGPVPFPERFGQALVAGGTLVLIDVVVSARNRR